MLQDIVLSVCMILAPDRCKDVRLQIASEFSASLQLPSNCMKQAQIEGQRWIEQHPGWRIVSWKCPPAARKRSDA